MNTNGNASGCCTGDGIDGLSMGVAAIDTRQRHVIDGFDAVFDEEEGEAVEFFEIVEEVVGHAIRTSAYDEPYDIGNGEGFFVFVFKVLEGIVGVGVGLEISEVLHVGVFAREKTLALLKLLGDGLLGDAIVGIEGLVVAIGAATRAHPSITIGTGEASVERDFLHLHAQLFFQPKTIFVVSFHFTKTHQSDTKLKISCKTSKKNQEKTLSF